MSSILYGSFATVSRRPRIFRGCVLVICVVLSVSGHSHAADRLTDEAIDTAGHRVLDSLEFRSVRRRLAENPASDAADSNSGFIRKALEWARDGISGIFSRIGDFFNWMFSGLWKPASARGQTSSDESSWMGFLRGIGDFIEAIFTVGGNAVLIVIFGALAAFLILVLAVIIRKNDRQNRVRKGLLQQPENLFDDIIVAPGEHPPSAYEARAVKLAEKGEYRAAIRELLLGSMSWMERAALIRYRRGLTNRDYLRCVWRRQEKRTAYLATASQFEFVYFGRRQPTPEMFETCLTEFRGAFHDEETPTATV